MPRTRNFDVRLYCINCKESTQSINPISIITVATNRFHIKAMCYICNKFKTKFLNKEQIKLLPKEIRESEDGSNFNKNVIIEGTAIPLLALIPLVISGILALASAAGTTASVVLANKQANEDAKHHRKLESIARGNSISNNVIINNNDLQINGNGINPLLVSSIISIIQDLIKATTEAAIKIKQLIDGNNKVDESKVVSDDELIDKSIKILQGKGFDVCI